MPHRTGVHLLDLMPTRLRSWAVVYHVMPVCSKSPFGAQDGKEHPLQFDRQGGFGVGEEHSGETPNQTTHR